MKSRKYALRKTRDGRNLQTIKILSFCVLPVFFSTVVAGQHQTKMPTIGWLALRPHSPDAGIEVFRRDLNRLGYIEGKNVQIEYRSGDNDFQRLPVLAEELVRRKVDVIVTPAINETVAAAKATTAIPIVFVIVADPVLAGLVQSLARPGRNVTGFSNVSSILVGKRLELLKETVPALTRAGVVWNPTSKLANQFWEEIQPAARQFGVDLYAVRVSNPEMYGSAFREAVKSGVNGAVVQSIVNGYQGHIASLAAKNHLPAIYPREDYTDAGGLISYGPDRAEPYGRAAVYVDKILKGAKPADLPVEQPTKFEMVINLKAAKQIGLTVPPNVLTRADRVIR